MVYLLAEVAQMQVRNEVSTVEEFAVLSIFYDADGVPRDTLGDMVWRAWVEGSVSSDLGKHELRLEVPEGRHNVVDGKTVPAGALSAVICVVGFVVSFTGEARQHTLIDAANEIAKIMNAYKAGEIPDPRPLRFAQI